MGDIEEPGSQPSRNATSTDATLTRREGAGTLARMDTIQGATAPLRDLSMFSVRDGRLAPVTCVSCGCRLERHDDGTWWHFAGRGERDARGCIVECTRQPHYAPGGFAAAIG